MQWEHFALQSVVHCHLFDNLHGNHWNQVKQIDLLIGHLLPELTAPCQQFECAFFHHKSEINSDLHYNYNNKVLK